MNKIKPILRYAGGKTTKVDQFRRFLPSKWNLYVEPFLGSGAFLFSFLPKSAVVSDINPHLIDMYLVVKQWPSEFIEAINVHAKQDTMEHFFAVRDEYNKQIKVPSTDKEFLIQKAGNFIFLNCRCYNGLYRVNQSGEFNVGYYHGSRQPTRFDNIIETIPEISMYLNSNEIYLTSMSYVNIIDYITQLGLSLDNSFFMIDPPYDEGFTGYDASGWTKDDFTLLKEFVDIISAGNGKFLICNKDTEFVRNLFGDYVQYRHKVARYISCKGEERNAVQEIVITNYDQSLDRFFK